MPAMVKVKRHQLDGQRIKIEAENYKFDDIVLQKAVNSWTFGNILIGGIIGYSSSAVRRMMLVAPRVKRVPFSMRRRSFGESSTLSTKVPVLLLLSFRVYFRLPRLSRLTVMVQWFSCGSGDGSLTHFFVNPLNDSIAHAC